MNAQRSLRTITLFSFVWLGLSSLLATSVSAQAVEVRAPGYSPDSSWITIEIEDPASIPVLPRGWQRATFWDLRPAEGVGVKWNWSVEPLRDISVGTAAQSMGADLAICAEEQLSGQSLGCQLVMHELTGPSGARPLWSNLPGQRARLDAARPAVQLSADETLSTGDRFTDRWLTNEEAVASVDGVVMAEGIALTPSGPHEVILIREIRSDSKGDRTQFRFVAENGRTVAALAVIGDANSVTPVRASILSESDRLADDGLSIAYEKLSSSLQPGTIGFLQYSYDGTGANCLLDVDCPGSGICAGADNVAVPPVAGSCHIDLAALRSGWTTISDALSVDQTNIDYQTDGGDPGSIQTLPEVWDFSTLSTSNLQQRTFNTTRNDTGWSTCLESCAVRDLSAAPVDGSWQSYLKIDNYDSAGQFVTRDVFELNDNDTGANPSIDVPYVTQDQANASDRTQICFDDSGGTAADRLLRFFQFTGPDPASATVGVGDSWGSGNWTSCNDPDGLHLTLASACGDACYPGCPSGVASPRAQGLLGNGNGLSSTIQEDGYIHVAAGNYIPALLLLQETDIRAGADLFGVCNISPIRNRAMDWFWLHERYGLLALISGINDDGANGCGLIQPMDWSCFGDRTDGADFTWGPFPPYQIQAEACLNGTKIDWTLPADGSNLTGEPGITDWGYVVSWGDENDPDTLAEWTVNPNHTPLPGQPGYLAAPPGAEPTSFVISDFPGNSINATVVTSLQYTDPDAADTTPYRSGAFFKVSENPARLDPLVFQVGDFVVPMVSKVSTNLSLDWPAVGGASGYQIQIYDLDSDNLIPCPAGLNCSPSSNSTLFSGAALTSANYAFRIFAVDSCGAPSLN